MSGEVHPVPDGPGVDPAAACTPKHTPTSESSVMYASVTIYLWGCVVRLVLPNGFFRSR